jgi:hypothetical protein
MTEQQQAEARRQKLADVPTCEIVAELARRGELGPGAVIVGRRVGDIKSRRALPCETPGTLIFSHP